MAFHDEIKNRLVAQGVGTFGTDIFIGSSAIIPAGVGPFIVIIETGGTGAARTHQNAMERPTAQISARGDNPQTARAKLQLAYNALGGADGLYNIDLSGTRYVSVTARQVVTDVGKDGAGRAMLAFNIDAEKVPS